MKEQVYQEKKLGRGLSALLGENKAKKDSPIANSSSQNSVEIIEVGKIIAGIYQPRRNFNQTELEELADSIRENGIIQPIILRRAGEENQYEIIAGERRFRAAQIAGLNEVPAIVKKINNHEALELALIENIQREDLSIIEEAAGFQQLMDDFSYSQEQIARKVGKSRSHIANLLRILNLPQSVRDLLDKKEISMGHARAIINSENPERLAKKVAKEGLTVRAVEDLVRDEKIEHHNKNIPLLVRTESKVKFVNSEHLVGFENKLSELLGLKTKIFYNSFNNNGKITIKFSDFDKISEIISRLERN